MTLNPPSDAKLRKSAKPIVCYNVNAVPGRDEEFIQAWKASLEPVETVVVPPRDAASFKVPAGYGFRIISTDGPQVGDLNLWNANDLTERFFSGKTRQLHATHLTRGDRLWSNLPGLRPMATITHDSLEWYGWDEDGGGVHDVIGTRCDPYTNKMLTEQDYHHCCHSNLTRAMAKTLNDSCANVESLVHDVFNVFMCTGFTRDTHQYFMKASPVRPGDYLELLADIDLLGCLSSCPGGDCGSSHSDDSTKCYPLTVEVLKPSENILNRFVPEPANKYTGNHGMERSRQTLE